LEGRWYITAGYDPKVFKSGWLQKKPTSKLAPAKAEFARRRRAG
jgi:hypothetical protein